MHRKVPAGFGGRLRGKGPRPITRERNLAAQPILLALELAQHGCGVSWLMIRRRSRQFAADVPTKRSAMAFARGARTGVLMIWMSTPANTASKAAVNLVSRSRIRNRKPVGAVVEVHEQVAGLLGQPRSGRVGGDAEDVHPAGGVLDDEERVEPAQGDRVEVEQVAGQDRLGLRGRNCAQVGPARRGAGSIPRAVRIFHTVEAAIW